MGNFDWERDIVGGGHVRALGACSEPPAVGVGVVALVPAHNEQEQIAATVQSLLGQTVAPHRVVVMADNCTDGTVEVARANGAMVIETVDNRGKKAGALNQGIELLLPELADDDLLLVVDADSTLAPDWIENALQHLQTPGRGAVSAQVLCREGKGAISLLQRAEYAYGARRVARAAGRVWVLSGAAVAMSAGVARRLVAERGWVYDEQSLAEDYEMTLALRARGYDPRGFSDLQVVTDVMESWRDLWRQRVRWQRGTIETLRSYGWSRVTRRAWLTQAVAYGVTFLNVAVAASWWLAIEAGATPQWWWAALTPLFMAEQYVSARRSGRGPALLVAALVPNMIYGAFRQAAYWTALLRSLRRTTATWA